MPAGRGRPNSRVEDCDRLSPTTCISPVGAWNWWLGAGWKISPRPGAGDEEQRQADPLAKPLQRSSHPALRRQAYDKPRLSNRSLNMHPPVMASAANAARRWSSTGPGVRQFGTAAWLQSGRRREFAALPRAHAASVLAGVRGRHAVEPVAEPLDCVIGGEEHPPMAPRDAHRALLVRCKFQSARVGLAKGFIPRSPVDVDKPRVGGRERRRPPDALVRCAGSGAGYLTSELGPAGEPIPSMSER
jgi:hypothetical protein